MSKYPVDDGNQGKNSQRITQAAVQGMSNIINPTINFSGLVCCNFIEAPQPTPYSHK
ncbi:unnamed protein product [marine sediment metagenome]|uniref:Uncharacterized protein n=1 Tax=marine sediment metagenome TaxID=412755 RepID=X1DQL3_9ZZZZ